MKKNTITNKSKIIKSISSVVDGYFGRRPYIMSQIDIKNSTFYASSSENDLKLTFEFKKNKNKSIKQDKFSRREVSILLEAQKNRSANAVGRMDYRKTGEDILKKLRTVKLIQF